MAELASDPRCATNAARVDNREFVDGAVAGAVALLTVTEVTSRLRDRGVLVAPVTTAAEAIQDPQVAHLGLLDVEGEVSFARTPLAQFDAGSLSTDPALGEHSAAALRRFGVSDERVRELIDTGVVDD